MTVADKRRGAVGWRLEELLAEVRELAAAGFSEVEFLGQNVNAYRCPEAKAGLCPFPVSPLAAGATLSPC